MAGQGSPADLPDAVSSCHDPVGCNEGSSTRVKPSTTVRVLKGGLGAKCETTLGMQLTGVPQHDWGRGRDKDHPNSPDFESG